MIKVNNRVIIVVDVTFKIINIKRMLEKKSQWLQNLIH